MDYRIRLYHNVLQNPDEVNEKNSWSVAKFELEHIASSKIFYTICSARKALEEAYIASNHIHGDWRENDFWQVLHVSQARSTSVGDMFKIVDEDSTVIEAFEVASVGFEKVK